MLEIMAELGPELLHYDAQEPRWITWLRIALIALLLGGAIWILLRLV